MPPEAVFFKVGAAFFPKLEDGVESLEAASDTSRFTLSVAVPWEDCDLTGTGFGLLTGAVGAPMIGRPLGSLLFAFGLVITPYALLVVDVSSLILCSDTSLDRLDSKARSLCG